MTTERERIDLELGHIEWRHRRSAWVVVLVALFVLIVGLILVCWIYLFSPPGTVHYEGRAYRQSESWEELQSRFPGEVEDPADLDRVAGGSWRYRAILDDPAPPGVVEGSVPTGLCVQALDGDYWSYELIGGP